MGTGWERRRQTARGTCRPETPVPRSRKEREKEMDKLPDLLKFLRKRIYFRDGLAAILLAAGAAYFIVAKQVSPHLAGALRAADSASLVQLGHIAWLIGLALVELGAYGLWVAARREPRFPKHVLGVLFAPSFPKQIEDEAERFFDHLKQELKSHELRNEFSVKRLPPNLRVDSADEASALLRRAGGVTAIWGLLDQQRSGEGRVTGFSKLSYTFVCRPASIPLLGQQALAMVPVGQRRHVRERTEIADRRLLARDMGMVVRNIIGLVLMFDGRFSGAARVFGPLHAELGHCVQQDNSPLWRGFQRRVGYDLAYSLTRATGLHYERFLLARELFEIPANLCRAWLASVDQAIVLDPQNSGHFLSKGIYHFLLGEIDQAIRAVRRAQKAAPRAEATPNLSLAFLYNFAGRAKESREEYRRGMAKKTSHNPELIRQCTSFVRQSIDRFPEKPQLRLALATLELHRGSREEAAAALSAFVDDPPDELKLRPFVREGQRLLITAKAGGH